MSDMLQLVGLMPICFAVFQVSCDSRLFIESKVSLGLAARQVSEPVSAV